MHFHLAPLLTLIMGLHFPEILSIQKDNSTSGNQRLYQCNVRARSVHNSTMLREGSGAEALRDTVFKEETILNIHFKAKPLQ